MKILSLSVLVFVLITEVMSTTIVVAQEQPSLRTRADKLFLQGEYFLAAEMYQKIVDVKRPKVKDMNRLAECYDLINDYALAQNWYARVIASNDYSNDALLRYAEVLKKMGDYREAKKHFEAYAARTGKMADVQLAIDGVDSAIVWMSSPTTHILKNQGEINTANSEFGCFPIGNHVLYTGEPDLMMVQKAGKTGRSFLKIYSSVKDANGVDLRYPNILPDIFNDAAFHVGPVVADKDGAKLYVTRTAQGQQQSGYSHKFKKHNLELVVYTKNGDSWVETSFPHNDSEKYSVGHAALSDDEQTLYFASDMPGGKGGIDIWYVEVQPDGNWGAPKNAGETINSAGDEMFPSVYRNRLYFSSNGFAGMGGLDVFSAEGSRSNFKNRLNLRFPLNSASDDFAYVILGDDDDMYYGYVSSDRRGSVGSDDIYSFSETKPKVNIKLDGMVVNRLTSETIAGAQVTLLDQDGHIVSRKLADGLGQFSFPLARNRSYAIMGEMDKFHGDSLLIAAVIPNKDTLLSTKLHLQPIVVKGSAFVLEDIHYDFDKYDIRDDAKPILNQLVKTMRDNPSLKIELSSHTDSRGAYKYNMKLSQNRAESAVNYIVRRGISRDRIFPKGYGESKLTNRCADGVECSDAEHQANRRTEIRVIDFVETEVSNDLIKRLGDNKQD